MNIVLMRPENRDGSRHHHRQSNGGVYSQEYGKGIALVPCIDTRAEIHNKSEEGSQATRYQLQRNDAVLTALSADLLVIRCPVLAIHASSSLIGGAAVWASLGVATAMSL